MIKIPLLMLAIALVESGNNPNARGARGEVGAHQMMPANARRYTPEEFEQVIEKSIIRHRADVNVFNIALCWNAGEKALEGKAPVSSYRYAQRVQATYERLQK